MEEAQRILNAIMGRYNEIVHLLQRAPEEFEPIFWTTEDGETIACDWAEGFMEAIALRLAGSHCWLRKKTGNCSRRL